jgi:hypothetical protein
MLPNNRRVSDDSPPSVTIVPSACLANRPPLAGLKEPVFEFPLMSKENSADSYGTVAVPYVPSWVYSFELQRILRSPGTLVAYVDLKTTLRPLSSWQQVRIAADRARRSRNLDCRSFPKAPRDTKAKPPVQRAPPRIPFVLTP